MTLKAKHRAVAEAIQHQAAQHGIAMSIEIALDLAGQALMVALDGCDEEPRTELDLSAMWRPADEHERGEYEHGVVLGVGL